MALGVLHLLQSTVEPPLLPASTSAAFCMHPYSTQNSYLVWLSPAVGDLHGDIVKTKKTLQIARVAEEQDGKLVWTGGDTVVVQLGDVLDRGDTEIGEQPAKGQPGCAIIVWLAGNADVWVSSSNAVVGRHPSTAHQLPFGSVCCKTCSRKCMHQQRVPVDRPVTCFGCGLQRIQTKCSVCNGWLAGILRLLRELDLQARQAGGAVYMLNGNHESLNVCGDFRCNPVGLVQSFAGREGCKDGSSSNRACSLSQTAFTACFGVWQPAIKLKESQSTSSAS